MIDLLYFASLRETLKLEKEQLELPADINDIEGLKILLASRGDDWQAAFSEARLLASVNQNMANASTPIKAGDEVAFFPPVTGG